MNRDIRWIALLGLFAVSTVQAADWTATIERSSDPGTTLKELSFAKAEVPVEQEGEELTVVLEGTYRRSDWNLLWEKQWLQKNLLGKNAVFKEQNKNAKGKEKNRPFEFSLKIRLTGKETPVELQSVGPAGEIELEKLTVRFEDWNAFEASHARAPALKQTSFSPSLGLSFFSYKELGVPDISTVSLSARLSYTLRILPPHWDLDFGLFGDLLPLRKTGTEIATRSLGVSARAGFSLPAIRSPWRLKLLGGWEYSRMWTTGGAFGYKNMLRTQLYPVLEREIGNSILQAFLKLNPIMNGATFIPLSNNEFGVGLGWTHPMGNGHPLTISFDYNRLKVHYQEVQVEARTYAIFAAYGF